MAHARAYDVRALLGGAPPWYLAIKGYMPPDGRHDEPISRLRGEIVQRRGGMATTFGYGPRYLHSTGQLHKGGKPDGRFLQLLHVADDDLTIPGGDPSSFETLKRAQADGDLLIIREHGLPVDRLVLRGDPTTALRTLKENL